MTEHYRLPAIYSIREFPQVGGLMSYGPASWMPIIRLAYKQGEC